MNESVDESAVKLFTAQMEALECVVLALQAPGPFNAEALAYLLEKRLENRDEDDLTSLGVSQLLSFLRPAQKRSPRLRLIQGGSSDAE